uniref:Ovule protein n=1 Tax=Romanomermis culicivorax TaxID=13658 RepID=A0A915K545_ROMCU
RKSFSLENRQVSVRLARLTLTLDQTPSLPSSFKSLTIPPTSSILSSFSKAPSLSILPLSN